jgi:hypothetical protein
VNQQKPGIPTTALEVFASSKVTLGLFGVLVVLLLPATIFPAYSPVFLKPCKAILALLGLNLVTCTLYRLRSLRRATLIIHLGTLVILAGGLISTLGFVSTVNIYEGTSTATVFNWKAEQDVPLGLDLRVAGIHQEYYPVDVKVGVLRNGQKADLIMTRTGDSFVYEGFRVQVLSLDPRTTELELAVQAQDGRKVGTLSTSGRKELPSGFPLDFKLVAFKDPSIKRMWVDLELRDNSKVIAAGTSEVNRPLRWQGMQFFLTQVAADEMGRPYAGIQISKDPGIPYVYAGFVILGIGLLVALKRWLSAPRKAGLPPAAGA